MATLEPGKPLATREATLLVENPLGAGRHRFQLVVIREDRVASQPQEVSVELRRDAPLPP